MCTMSRRFFNALAEAGFNVRDDYSGRMMFGRECFGYEPDDGNLMLWIIQNLLEEGDDWEFCDELKNLMDCDAFERECTDSMGLGTIVYYPDIQVAEPDEDELAEIETDDDGE